MTNYKYNNDIFGALVVDHDKHRTLLDDLEHATGGTREQKALFEELTYELKGHALAEEQALWSTVLRKPEITEDGRHAVAEHKEIDDLLNDLAATDIATDAWSAKLRRSSMITSITLAKRRKSFFRTLKNISINPTRNIWLRCSCAAKLSKWKTPK